MKKLLLLLLMLVPSAALAKVQTLQVTLGSGNTQVLTTGAHLNVRWFVIENNATHNIHAGDTNITTTRGLLITPGGSFFVGPDQSGLGRDLGYWYLVGTSGDVIDIIYDDGTP